MKKYILIFALGLYALALKATPTVIDLNSVIIDKNPWLGEIRDLRNVAKYNISAYVCSYA
jgi:hypothetical protein